ncbi:MAG: LysM peptidoglycan-binding domain-containing protein [Clostridiales bacterium]|nr:LysM peptidoglycan-binding domain-containing protein [Clostridiales bacterium]
MEKFFYRVEHGDTILSVSNKFCTPAILIINLNNLKKEICAGDILYIEKENCKTYTVKPFETVEMLAQRFGVEKEELLQKNGVDYLFYGLTIKI